MSGTPRRLAEAANQINEISKATKDAYVAKRGSQLSSMLSGHTRGKQLTGKQQANAVKGIKQAMGGTKKEETEIQEAPYTPANDYEGEMAMTQLKSVMEKAGEILGMLKPEAKMEAWVQSKITLADEYISCVRDYLKHTPGAVSEVANQVSAPVTEVMGVGLMYSKNLTSDRRLLNDILLKSIEKAYKKGGLRGKLEGVKSLGFTDETTVEDFLSSFKSYFKGSETEPVKYVAQELKKILKPEDYAKFKTQMESVVAKEETEIKEAIEDDDEAYDPKDVEAVVKVCKALQSKGVGGKSAFKNFAHFKLLWQAWYELGKMKTADKKGILGYLSGIDPFKEQGFKAAKRAGCAGAWNALIGSPGFYAAFLDWADGEVEGRYIKPVNTIQKSVLDMFWRMFKYDA